MLESLVSSLIVLFARFVTAVRPIWSEDGLSKKPAIYFANHASHGDFVLIWTVLPPPIRRLTRPVAGADYWLTSALKRFIAERVFRAVLIERNAEKRTDDPIGQMGHALQESSIILFPEGTRNLTDEPLLPFKSGLYHLARKNPEVPLIPVWIENLNRVMPKGEMVPVPFLCTVTFGDVIQLGENESKVEFLDRAHKALLTLRSDSNNGA